MDILISTVNKFFIKTLLRLSIFLYFTTVIFFFSPKNAYAETILFQDNFDDGDAAGWSVIGSSGWNVTNGEYGILLNPGLSNSIPDSWDFSWTNISYDLDMRGIQGVDRNILVKFVNTSNFIELHVNASGMILEKASTGGGGGILASNSLTLSNDVNYHFRFEISNNNGIRVYLNNSLIFDVTENTPLTNWKVGLRAGTGGVPITEVRFDNIIVKDLISITPSPTPTSTPTPTATPSAAPTSIGMFELPFDYPGRPATNPADFRSGFWGRLTASFDHTFPAGIHRPFTGNSYTDCVSPLSCYDSHNGTDFSHNPNENVYSVASGYTVYTSPHTDDSCTPESTFGCVIIARYPGNNYALYAHLDKIFVSTGDSLTQSSLIGEMGETGCPGCGEHLHFGVLRPAHGIKNTILSMIMSKKDWAGLLSQMSSDSNPFQAFCTYQAPNNSSFSFVDPSGWRGSDKDPWSLPLKKGGCGINSHYLWKFDIGSTP